MLCFALMSLYQSCLNFLSFLSMILVCHYYLSVPIESRQMCQRRRRQASALKCFYVSVLPYSVTAVDPCLSTAPRAETLYSVRLWLLWRMDSLLSSCCCCNRDKTDQRNYRLFFLVVYALSCFIMIFINQYVQSKQAQITLDVSMLAICR